MHELDIQDKYLVQFLCDKPGGLHYHEVKANTVAPQGYIPDELRQFLRDTTLNREGYRKLLRKFGTEATLMQAFWAFLRPRILSEANMAVFFNSNKTVTFEGVKLHLFYPSGSETYEDRLFEENRFAVVQELPVGYRHEGQTRFSFRPDLTFFLNGLFLGYAELKSTYNNQNARDHGRRKVARDYEQAVRTYADLAAGNDTSQRIRRELLYFFEKAIHITATDLRETYVTRSLGTHFDELRATAGTSAFDFDKYQDRVLVDFKPYPVGLPPEAPKTQRFEEVFRALYDKRMIEREILYYNFLERELVKDGPTTAKTYKHSDGQLISPRPKQKFGTDKVLARIDELLAHESEPDYYIEQLRQQLVARGVGAAQVAELIAKRQQFQNNKYVYSLLLQYAAGFGKSNIIGWTALQLKDLRRNGGYVYDKVLLVVDRVQLRDALDTKMHNLNIQKSMFAEATNKQTFVAALTGETRIIVVNLQKFARVADALTPEVLTRLTGLRVAFLIDEIHRSNTGDQHTGMVTLFDELQTIFDTKADREGPPPKKNLIVGFTATPSDHTLARFGEFATYAENRPIWVPFDAYTMREAIEDGFILNPLKGVVPVSAKMFFELPDNVLEGFEGDTGYAPIPEGTDTGIDGDGRRYAIRKRRIYENKDRIAAIAQFVAERLVTTVYRTIRGTGKAMLAVSSIPAAIQYKAALTIAYQALVKQKKEYARFADAPIFIVYSNSGQEYPSAKSLNGGLSEATVLQEFTTRKNGLIIVVDKLQTGFDERKLHTLFLDKEISGINAIQTISRVNRTAKYKTDCKIVDFSYKNINVGNIQKAFEHFSNVVVSDFDPLGAESQLAAHYADLRQHPLYLAHFATFAAPRPTPLTPADVQALLDITDAFGAYIATRPDEAAALKGKVGKYFRVLRLIEGVLVLNATYHEPNFLDFWRRFNHEYTQRHRPTNSVDDVEVYFDDAIGIVAPTDYTAKAARKPSVVSEDAAPHNTKYKFNILRVIEKRNQEEAAIEELIHEFEAKIELFFAYIRTDDAGKRLTAKMRDQGTAFDADEIADDFTLIYRKFVRRHKAEVGEFFVRETHDLVNQLRADFEKTL